MSPRMGGDTGTHLAHTWDLGLAVGLAPIRVWGGTVLDQCLPSWHQAWEMRLGTGTGAVEWSWTLRLGSGQWDWLPVLGTDTGD